jgi:hypothetical protein
VKSISPNKAKEGEDMTKTQMEARIAELEAKDELTRDDLKELNAIEEALDALEEDEEDDGLDEVAPADDLHDPEADKALGELDSKLKEWLGE